LGISRAALAGAGVSLLGFAAIAALGIARGVFLHDGDTAAHWLVATPRVRGETYPIQTISAAYRRVFVLERPAPAETLDLYTIERAAVWLDGEPVHFDGETEPDPRGRTRRAVALGPLAAGEHTLTVYVDASMNPPRALAARDRLPVATDARWSTAGTASAGMPRRSRLTGRNRSPARGCFRTPRGRCGRCCPCCCRCSRWPSSGIAAAGACRRRARCAGACSRSGARSQSTISLR
jgi:hypothetical protein